MSVKLSPKNISDIENCLNRRSKTEVILKVESGKIVVILAERKKIA